jgi:hypothetical protein
MARIVLQICAVAMFLFCITAKTQDADKQKLIEIENAFAKTATPGADAAAVCKQYMYEGALNQLTFTGRVGTLTKSRIMDICSKPDPSDPGVKSSAKISDVHVEIYGETALVTYKNVDVDTGHKDAALNTTFTAGCMDTFVKRNGAWFIIGNACSPSAALPSAEWAALKKARAEEPKDIQQAYH